VQITAGWSKVLSSCHVGGGFHPHLKCLKRLTTLLQKLGLMRPTACLINVARAEIVDEAALYRALSTSALAGAALDVWWRYPTAPGPVLPSTQPFHELPNVIMTPHVSGWTEGMLEARAKIIADNIARTARGEPPINAVASVG
jgi:phosphoglycerate dehydrogenase-like enzyme